MIEVPIKEASRKPPYCRAGLNGLWLMALNTGDAAEQLEALRQNPDFEIVSATKYQFNDGNQAGFVVVYYQRGNDPFYRDDAPARPIAGPPL